MSDLETRVAVLDTTVSRIRTDVDGQKAVLERLEGMRRTLMAVIGIGSILGLGFGVTIPLAVRNANAALNAAREAATTASATQTEVRALSDSVTSEVRAVGDAVVAEVHAATARAAEDASARARSFVESAAASAADQMKAAVSDAKGRIDAAMAGASVDIGTRMSEAIKIRVEAGRRRVDCAPGEVAIGGGALLGGDALRLNGPIVSNHGVPEGWRAAGTTSAPDTVWATCFGRL